MSVITIINILLLVLNVVISLVAHNLHSSLGWGLALFYYIVMTIIREENIEEDL